MNFELKGKVNYLPVATYRHLKCNYAEIDYNFDISSVCLNRINESIEKYQVLKNESRYEEILNSAEKVKTGMEAKNLDSKALGDSIHDEDRNNREIKDAASTGLISDAISKAGIETEIIEIPRDEVVEIHLPYKIEESNLVTDYVIYLGENSKLTLIETYKSESKENLFGIRTRVIAKKGSSLKLVRVNLLSNKTEHFDDMGFEIEDEARVELINLDLGSQTSYLGARAELVGKKSEFYSYTGYLCMQEKNLDINFVVNEWGRKTYSKMFASGVLFDTSKKTYRGTIDFKEGARGSKGFENEETLLFSDNIINKSAPLILCHEEDVEGDHGASIGKIDENLLFYLSSRGIDEDTAKTMLAKSYINSVANKICNEEIEKEVRDYISEVLLNAKQI